MQAKRLMPHLAGTVVVLLAMFAVACSSSNPSQGTSSKQKTSSAPDYPNTAANYNPNIDPSNFVKKIDNAFFPLKPGTKYESRTETSDGIGHETLTVTHKTKGISGVTTTVVKDVSHVGGELEEKTYDWYAQDKQGNVWYFGEDTAEYKNGKVTTREGSWKTGVHGAKPGIIMNADPQVTDSYRQEYQKGVAVDMYWVIAKNQKIKVPDGTFHNALLTMEWTPLEPKIASEKYYVPGIGIVAERNLSGGKENVELLKVTHNG